MLLFFRNNQFTTAIPLALYVLLTRRNAATLLTFDKRLHLACADARISSEWFSA